MARSPVNHAFFSKRWGKISHTSVHGFLVTQSLQFRRMTSRARPFIEHPIMSVITVKSPFRKRTPDTMVNMTDGRQYRRSLLLRSFRQLSRSYFASEKSWEFVIEALLFAIIVTISALPDLRSCGRAAPVSVAHRKLSASTTIWRDSRAHRPQPLPGT